MFCVYIKHEVRMYDGMYVSLYVSTVYMYACMKPEYRALGRSPLPSRPCAPDYQTHACIAIRMEKQYMYV